MWRLMNRLIALISIIFSNAPSTHAHKTWVKIGFAVRSRNARTRFLCIHRNHKLIPIGYWLIDLGARMHIMGIFKLKVVADMEIMYTHSRWHELWHQHYGRNKGTLLNKLYVLGSHLLAPVPKLSRALFMNLWTRLNESNNFFFFDCQQITATSRNNELVFFLRTNGNCLCHEIAFV